MATRRRLQTIFASRGATVCDFPPGWTQLLSELHDTLCDIDPEYRVVRVEVSPLGGLEFHVSTASDVTLLQRLIMVTAKAEHDSKQFCEQCGTTDDVRKGRTAYGRNLRTCMLCTSCGDFG